MADDCAEQLRGIQAQLAGLKEQLSTSQVDRHSKSPASQHEVRLQLEMVCGVLQSLQDRLLTPISRPRAPPPTPNFKEQATETKLEGAGRWAPDDDGSEAAEQVGDDSFLLEDEEEVEEFDAGDVFDGGGGRRGLLHEVFMESSTLRDDQVLRSLVVEQTLALQSLSEEVQFLRARMENSNGEEELRGDCFPREKGSVGGNDDEAAVSGEDCSDDDDAALSPPPPPPPPPAQESAGASAAASTAQEGRPALAGKAIRLPVALPTARPRSSWDGEAREEVRSPSPQMDAPMPCESPREMAVVHSSALGSAALPTTLDDLDAQLETISLRSSPSETTGCIDIHLTADAPGYPSDRREVASGLGSQEHESSSDGYEESDDICRDWQAALEVGEAPVTSGQFMEALLRDDDDQDAPRIPRTRRKGTRKVRRKKRKTKKDKTKKPQPEADRRGHHNRGSRTTGTGLPIEDDEERFDREAAAAAALAVDLQTSSLPPPTPSLDWLKGSSDQTGSVATQETRAALGEISSTRHSLNHRIIRGVRKKLRAAQRASLPVLDEETICDIWLWIAKVVQDVVDGEFEEDDEPENMQLDSSAPNSPRAVLRRGLAERLAGGELLGAFWAICTRYSGSPPNDETMGQMLGDLSELLYDEMCFSTLHAVSYSSSQPTSAPGDGLEKANPAPTGQSSVTRMRARDKTAFEPVREDDLASPEADDHGTDGFVDQGTLPMHRQCQDVRFPTVSMDHRSELSRTHDYNAAALPLIGSLESSSDEDLGAGLRLGDDLTLELDVDTPDDDDDNDEDGDFEVYPGAEDEGCVSIQRNDSEPPGVSCEQGSTEKGVIADANGGPGEKLRSYLKQAERGHEADGSEDYKEDDKDDVFDQPGAAQAAQDRLVERRLTNPVPVVAFRPVPSQPVAVEDLVMAPSAKSLDELMDESVEQHKLPLPLIESVVFRDMEESSSDAASSPADSTAAVAEAEKAPHAVDLDARLDDAIRGLEASLYREPRRAGQAVDDTHIALPSFLQMGPEKLDQLQSRYRREQLRAENKEQAHPIRASQNRIEELDDEEMHGQRRTIGRQTIVDRAVDPATYAGVRSGERAPRTAASEGQTSVQELAETPILDLRTQGNQPGQARAPLTAARVFSIEVDLEVFDEEEDGESGIGPESLVDDTLNDRLEAQSGTIDLGPRKVDANQDEPPLSQPVPVAEKQSKRRQKPQSLRPKRRSSRATGKGKLAIKQAPSRKAQHSVPRTVTAQRSNKTSHINSQSNTAAGPAKEQPRKEIVASERLQNSGSSADQRLAKGLSQPRKSGERSKGSSSAKLQVRWAEDEHHHIFDPAVAVSSPPRQRSRKVASKQGRAEDRDLEGAFYTLQDSEDIRALELGLQAYEQDEVGPAWTSD